MDLFAKLVGAAGLVLVTVALVLNKRKLENVLNIIGGVFLGVYSIYIKDALFIILEIIFILAAIYDLIGAYRTKKKKA